MIQRHIMPVPPILQPFARTVLVDDLTLHCYMSDTGGTPIVLVHGLGDEADTWQHIFPKLATQQTTVAFDLPGFGRSDKPRRAYTYAFFARTLESLLNTLGFEKAVLVGHSLGAAIVQRLVLARPHLVERLVLLSGGLPIEASMPAGPMWMFLTPGVGELLYTSLRRSQDQAYETLRPFYYDLDALSEEDQTFLRERVWARVWSSGQRPAFLSAFRWLHIDGLLRASDYHRALQRLAIQTDIIWGAHDYIRPVAAAEELAKILPDAHLHIITDGGHNVHQERPVEVVNIIL